jgi:phosphoribosyl 1,2-cyclic phosphate phosphodiesterase
VRLTFLGTGTSFGVPVVGCDCAVCSSAGPPGPEDPPRGPGVLGRRRDPAGGHPARSSGSSSSAARVDRVDAVWFTHGHADHVHGIDDLRIFSLRGRRNVPVYVSSRYRDEMEARFRYIFDPDIRPDQGSSKPELQLHEVEETGNGPLILGRRVLPLPVPHGSVTVLGFRVGDLGYITDAKTLPPETLRRLEGVRLLVLNALWFGRPHPSHFNVEEAVEMAERVGAELTYLTHLTHRTSHDELERRLPPGVRPAWDGLTVEVDARGVREVPEGGVPPSPRPHPL